MLRKITEHEFEQYIEFAYELAMDLSKASFPIYNDGIKTKELFWEKSRKGLDSEEEEILLYLRDGVVEGWIHFYVIKEDQYIGPQNILVNHGYQEALKELLTYWNENYSGYEWNIYLPNQNKEALSFMKQNGYEILEENVVDVMLFDQYTIREEFESVVKVTKENFEWFRQLHVPVEDDMYWTSSRIYETLGEWSIYAYVKDSICLATIYNHVSPKRHDEIVGVDWKNDWIESEILEALLVTCLNASKRSGAYSMYYFNDLESHKVAKTLGFNTATIAYFFQGKCK